VLHRVFGPADEASWDRLWHAGRLEEAPLAAYLASVEDRFDLFDARRPCGQVAGLPERLAGPVARLAPEQSTGRQATVWDHHCDDEQAPVTASLAARWLFSHHNFCLSGCCGDGQGLRGVPAGPLAHMATFMACGENLLQTLLLNLAPYNPADAPRRPEASAGGEHPPIPAVRTDLPAWERAATPDPEAPPTGVLDLLTWQPRSILLLPCGRARPGRAGGGVVEKAIAMLGRQFSLRRLACDPMVAYFADGRLPDAWRPLRLQPGDIWWSHVARVARPSTARWRRPLVLEMLARRVARGVVPAAAGVRVAVMGLAGDKARVDLWRRDLCRLPAACLSDENRLADLEIALQVAERTHCILSEHLEAARGLQMLGKPAEFPEGRPPHPAAGGGLASEQHGFWSGLQDAIAALPGRLTGSVDERGETLRWWTQSCHRQAFRTWSVASERLARRRSSWRRQAQLQDQLARALRRESGACAGG
jgi:CRISPR system Cascade subunit CasA